MKIARTVSELRDFIKKSKAANHTIGLVPTMGALHAGHASLVRKARQENDIVVVSVFVNPTQFNNPDDLAKYPRTEEAYTKLLESLGVDLAFIPTVEDVYGEQPDTRIFDLGPVAEVMEGAMRPGHFNGVAQIVSRLFKWSEPTRAYFGEKDFQQIAVIRRMAQLEGLEDIEIVACPIVREDDGLALSSRNVRLSPEMRRKAPAIHKTLLESIDDKKNGLDIDETVKNVTDKLNAIDNVKVEYYSIVHPLTMQPINSWDESAHPVGCITVYFGDVRLIDNIKY